MSINIYGASILVRALSIVTCVVLVVTGLAAVWGAWSKAAPFSTSQRDLLPAARGAAQMVHFTIYDAGIFPPEVRVRPGVIALHFEDVSTGSAGLAVADESSRTIAQVLRRPGRWRDNSRYALVRGRYVIYDVSRPLNRATLIVEP